MYHKDVAKKSAKASARAVTKETKSAKQAAKQDKTRTTKAAKKSGKDATTSVHTKHPYRPRFAVAPRSVRVFTVTGFVAAFFNLSATITLWLITTDVFSVDTGLRPAMTAVLAVVCLLLAVSWLVVALKVSRGSRFAWRLGLSLSLLSMFLFAPVSLVAMFALVRPSTRAWAI